MSIVKLVRRYYRVETYSIDPVTLELVQSEPTEIEGNALLLSSSELEEEMDSMEILSIDGEVA